jgi:hypothetical protein
MNYRTIESLLNIVRESNRHPKLRHLRDAALRELELARLSAVETILPVTIVDLNNDQQREVLTGGDYDAQQTGRDGRADRDIAQ